MKNEKNYRIALYPGDGIGIEVLDEAVKVLKHCESLCGDFSLEFDQFDWGCDYYDKHGKIVEPGFLEMLKPYDAIFLGAVGYPSRLPDHLTLDPLIKMRQGFDQYACVRPARTFEGVKSPLENKTPIDMVIVRENSEGEYVVCGGRFKEGQPGEHAIQNAIHSRKGVKRIIEFAFELARTRKKKLTMITKSNALRYSMVLWDEVLEELMPQYPDIETDKQHVDAASMNFVRRPETFDVVVASNLFGDILSDLAGSIVGGLGLLPSANLNPERTFPSLFEPVHGSAPDITGKGIANPIATILSGAMMLDWLGEKKAAAMINQAVEQVLKTKECTPDLGGKMTTTEVTDEVLGMLTPQ